MSDALISAIKQEGVAAWVAYRESRGGTPIVFRANLEGLDLSDFDFSGVDLKQSNFNRCTCHRTNFSRAILDGVSMVESKIENARFDEASCDHTAFMHSDIKRSSFIKCRANNARFDQARLNDVTFDYANLTDSRFAGAKIEESSFIDVRLQNSAFNDAVIEDTTFQSSHLYDSNWSGASLAVSHCKETRWDGTNLADALVLKSDFTLAHLEKVDFTGAKLHDCIFSEATFYESNFERCDCFESRFIEASGLGGDDSPGQIGARTTAAINADHAHVGDKWSSWIMIRRIGSLPLFGVSYVGIIAIAIWASTVHRANIWIDALKLKASGTTAQDWTSSLPYITVSLQTKASLISLLCLALAATFYRIWCPPDIQRFDETEWVNQLQKSHLYYKMMGQRRRKLRRATFILYCISVPVVLVLLGVRIICALIYTIEG